MGGIERSRRAPHVRRGVVAVDRSTWTRRPGEVTALVGPNGVGQDDAAAGARDAAGARTPGPRAVAGLRPGDRAARRPRPDRLDAGRVRHLGDPDLPRGASRPSPTPTACRAPRSGRAVDELLDAGPPHRVRRPPDAGALPRPEAAARAGPGAGPRPGRPAARRAGLRPRPALAGSSCAASSATSPAAARRCWSPATCSPSSTRWPTRVVVVARGRTVEAETLGRGGRPRAAPGGSGRSTPRALLAALDAHGTPCRPGAAGRRRGRARLRTPRPRRAARGAGARRRPGASRSSPAAGVLEQTYLDARRRTGDEPATC